MKSSRLLTSVLALSATFTGAAHAQAYQTISQTISDTANDTLSFSFYLNSDGDTPNFFGVNIDGTTVFSQSDIPFQNYTEYTFSLTAAGTDTINFEESNTNGFLALDTITVLDNTSPANDPNLINGSFETGDFTGWTLSDPGDLYTAVVNVAFSDTETISPNDGSYFAALGYAPNTPPPPVSNTPEPSSLILLGTGVLSMAGAARRRRR